MKERPILFSAPMVRALLDGSKTQTRRIVKPQHLKFFEQSAAGMIGSWNERPAPYGLPGDQLWVRETWSYEIHALAAMRTEDGPFVYAATDSIQHRLHEKWTPSIHMPRLASRITLEITGVRVERLQDISEADAIAEGCAKNHNGYYWGGPHAVSGLKQMATAKAAYRDLWESINGPGSWDANPLVWVIEFRRIEK